MSFIKKAIPITGIFFSLSTFAGEKRALEDEKTPFIDLSVGTLQDDDHPLKIARYSADFSFTISTNKLITNFTEAIEEIPDEITDLTIGDGKVNDTFFHWVNYHTNNNVLQKKFSQLPFLKQVTLSFLTYKVLFLKEFIETLRSLVPSLQTLDIHYCQITEGEKISTASSNLPETPKTLPFPPLKSVSIRDTVIKEQIEVAPLSAALQPLENFLLKDSNIDPYSLRRLLTEFHYIRELSIVETTGIKKEMPMRYIIPIIFQEKQLPYLTRLSLLMLKLEDENLGFFSHLKGLEHLTTLELGGNAFTVSGVINFLKQIMSAKKLPNLNTLNLDCSKKINTPDGNPFFTEEEKNLFEEVIKSFNHPHKVNIIIKQ